MKITKVEPFLMSFKMPEPLRLPFWGGERAILKRDAMLIRLTTDTGLKGFAPGPAFQRAATAIREIIAPFLVGKDPRQWNEFEFHSDPETIKTYHAVEIALLDLLGRYEGCAISELLGGRKRGDIKLYGSAGMYMSPEKYAKEAAAIAGMGFPAYKMRLGIGPVKDLEALALMRQAVGPNVGIMIDAHTWWRMGDRSYSLENVQQLAGEMAVHDVVWLEEPLPPEDHAAYRKLRSQSQVKLASGEHEPDYTGFQDLIESRAVDYVQMDVLCQGGYSVGWRILEGVERQGLRFAFHSWGTSLEALAAAHLGICWPEHVVEWLEYPCYSSEHRAGMYPFPLADEILNDPLDIREGRLYVSDEPGLGVEINESVVEKYPFIPGPWSYFQLDSPRETIAVTGEHSIKWITGEQHD